MQSETYVSHRSWIPLHSSQAPLLHRFTEGFDTAGLREAKALLDELSSGKCHLNAKERSARARDPEADLRSAKILRRSPVSRDNGEEKLEDEGNGGHYPNAAGACRRTLGTSSGYARPLLEF